MADTITSSKELKLGMDFYDGDTRILTEDNPRGGLSATDIHELEALMISKNILIGDKTGAPFVGFNSAKIVKKQRLDVDLS